MDPEVVRRQILNFIRVSFNEHFFERAKDYSEDNYFREFGSYEDFLNDQRRIFNTVPLAQLERYRVAVIDSQNSMYRIIDWENINFQKTHGFVLDPYGRIAYITA